MYKTQSSIRFLVGLTLVTIVLPAQAQPAAHYRPAPPPVQPFGYPAPYRSVPYPPQAYWPAPMPAYRGYPPPVAPASGITAVPAAAARYRALPYPRWGYWPAPMPAYRAYPPPQAAAPDVAPEVAPTPMPARIEQTEQAGTSKPAAATRPPTKQSSLSERQMAFLKRLLPVVERENARLMARRTRLLYLLKKAETQQLTEPERTQLHQLARQYRVSGNPLSEQPARDELRERIDVIPESLVLAQAANESAWGSSRFAREGNNLFGIWTYDVNKGIVPKHRAAGKRHLVRRFDSIDEGVRYYMHTLNSHPAYRTLRHLRAQARARGERPQGVELAAGLTKYSARGEEYVRLIRELIHRYDLASIATQRHTG